METDGKASCPLKVTHREGVPLLLWVCCTGVLQKARLLGTDGVALLEGKWAVVQSTAEYCPYTGRSVDPAVA